jgi:membrane-anchored glycerophosphoryl diester phosphodiesterase (GDPDase)
MLEDSGKRQQVVYMAGSKAAQKKSLIDAISEIQQYSVMEKQGTEVPGQFLALKGKIEYMGIGIKSGFIIGLFMSIAMPFVMTESIQNILLCAVIPLSVGLLFGIYIPRFCSGEMSKTMIKNMLAGFWTGALFSLIIAACVYYGLVMFIENRRYVPQGMLQWLVSVRPLLKQCPKWILLGTLLTSVLPFYKSIFLKIRR